MPTLRRLLGLDSMQHVERQLQLFLDVSRIDRDRELLDRTRRLVLVDEQHRLTLTRQAVERGLLDVSRERSADVTPHRLPVGPVLLVAVDEHLLRVAREELRSFHPHRAIADRLDLQQGVAGHAERIVGRVEVDVSVRVPEDVVLRQTDGNLAVLQVIPRRPTLRAVLGRGRHPPDVDLGLRPVAVSTPEAPVTPPQHPRSPRPVLPLVVIAGTRSEDDIELEGDLLVRDLPPGEPVVQRPIADVRFHQLARVQNVMPSITVELLLCEQVALDRPKQHRLPLERIHQRLDAHTCSLRRIFPRSRTIRRRHRRSFARSCSLIPPQIPYFSLASMAYSRQV